MYVCVFVKQIVCIYIYCIITVTTCKFNNMYTFFHFMYVFEVRSILYVNILYMTKSSSWGQTYAAPFFTSAVSQVRSW